MKYKEAHATHAAPSLTVAEIEGVCSGDMPWDQVVVITSDAPASYLELWHDADVYDSNFLFDGFYSYKARQHGQVFQPFQSIRTQNAFITTIGMYASIYWADSEQFGANRPWAFLMLFGGVDGNTITSWDGEPMDKLAALVVDGCPPNLALQALHNGIDTHLISSL